jgi:phosphoglycolate phosphatase-like HAD superfamily hydrolase
MTAPADQGPDPGTGSGSSGQRPGGGTGVRTLVFDVLGTVVDEAGSIRDLVTAALAAAGADPAGGPAFAARWNERVEALTTYVARPDEGVPGPADRFDVRVRDLAELAARLAGAG